MHLPTTRTKVVVGKNAPSVASKSVKQFQWRPRNTPRIEKHIIVVLKPRETLDLKATFGPGQAGAAVRSIIAAVTSVGLAELEAKQAGSSEPVQGADVEDGDDGSSVTSCLTSVSRQGADTVVGSVSATGHTGRLESLERKTEQLEERVAALPNQIMSAVRESLQDMFMAAITQALLK
ncbi:hypothetical protein MTO96_048501 [Rhipicephalus appendiculatus]